MGTGYMGADEPEIVPRGMPSANEPSEKTLTNFNQAKETVEPVVTTTAPVGDIIPDANPVVAAEAPEPKVVEKIVEKIVEKYPEFKDEDSKALYEAWVNGEMDKVKAYWREMDKDYNTMSHIDVIREGLAKKHPQWSQPDIELELRSEYGKQLEKYDLDDFNKETDPEGYKEALAHNERADANTLKLERDARDYRISLKEGQKTVELPKIKNDAPPVEAQVAPTQEQLDEAVRMWAEAADSQVKDLADYKFSVGDDKNPEDVVFAVTDEEKSARTDAMKKWTGKDFMARRGWTNPDGTFNLLNIAKDEHTLDNNEKMVKSAYTQGVTNGRKLEVAKIKNIDHEQHRQSEVPGQPADASALIWG